MNGDLTDGDFFLDFSTQERCPASYGALFIFPALTIQQKLAVVDLKNVTASKTTLGAGNDSLTLTADIKVSGALFAPVSVNVIPYAQYTSAGNDIWNPTLQTLSFSSAGTTQQATFTYDFSPINGTSYPLSADLKINLSATSGVTILPPEKKVTINIIP